MSHLNEGIISYRGVSVVRASGRTEYVESKWTVSPPTEEDRQPESAKNIRYPGVNKGIVSIGGCGNVQASGQTSYGKSRWVVRAQTKKEDKRPESEESVDYGGQNKGTMGEANSGIISISGAGNVEASGFTNYGSSQWTLESESTEQKEKQAVKGIAKGKVSIAKGKVSIADGNVKASGETDFGSSKWRVFANNYALSFLFVLHRFFLKVTHAAATILQLLVQEKEEEKLEVQGKEEEKLDMGDFNILFKSLAEGAKVLLDGKGKVKV